MSSFVISLFQFVGCLQADLFGSCQFRFLTLRLYVNKQGFSFNYWANPSAEYSQSFSGEIFVTSKCFLLFLGFAIKRSLMLIIPRGVINGLLSNLPPQHGERGTCSGRISLVVGAPTQKPGKPVVRRGTLHLLASACQHMKRTCLKEKLLKHTQTKSIMHTNYKSLKL